VRAPLVHGHDDPPMDRERVQRILEAVRDGGVSPDDALRELGGLDIAELSAGGPAFARLDHHRGVRCGFPEVVYAPGKTPEQVAAIAVQSLSRSDRLLVTRLEAAQILALTAAVPDMVFHERARAATVERRPRADG